MGTKFGMLSFLRTRSVPRTKISHLSTLSLEGGRSTVKFSSAVGLASGETTILFTLPPAATESDSAPNSFLIPPYHFHPRQNEIFNVTSGDLLMVVEGRKVVVSAGETFMVHRFEYHSFSNASTTESATLEVHFDPANRRREERFFRNLCGYLEDCNDKGKAMGTGASFAQIVAFTWEADIIPCELGGSCSFQC